MIARKTFDWFIFYRAAKDNHLQE